MSMNDKVLPSRKTPIPPGTKTFPSLTGSNPTQRSNPPAVPPGHRTNGEDGAGNGPGVYMPSGK